MLVFGGNGFAGSFILHAAECRGINGVSADTDGAADRIGAFCRVDITDAGAVRRLVDDCEPSIVVNTAAVADIDFAQSHQDLAWRVNVKGPMNIAAACERNGVLFVHFSSDAVFDGTREYYAESDSVSPLNYYGKSKAASERAVLDTCANAIVIRLSLLLGPPRGNSFLAKLDNAQNTGACLYCPRDELRTPIDLYTLAACIFEMSSIEYRGLLHLGATDFIDRYTLAEELCARLEYYNVKLTDTPQAASSQQRARRSKRGCLDVCRAQSLLETELLCWRDTAAKAVELHEQIGALL